MTDKIKPSEKAIIAFDRASTRLFDKDGHLHVKRTAISKANVCDYLGSEIPGFEDLGLDADRRYKLLRDPDELAKAADSFNNKPLLFDHNPVSADDHDHSRTVGVVSNPVFEHPYLYADLACWSGPAIRLIEDGSQKELSSAYRYEPDMTPGTFDGVRYDGVMRGLFANHVALVKKGRAGPDVVVGDAAPGTIIMQKNALTAAAAHTQGALSMYLRPKLAQDAKVDLRTLIDGLTAKNFKRHKPILALGLKGATHGKLAADADLSDVEDMLDRVEEAVEDLQETVEDVPATPATSADPDAKDASEDDILSFLSGKLSDEDLEAVRGMLSSTDTTPAPMAGDDADKGKDRDGKDKPAQDKAPDMSKFITRAAMDAAIKRASDEAAAAANAHQVSLREAERFVRPWAGDLPAMDSAEAYHRAACDVIGIDHRGVHASALPVLIQRSPKPGDQPTRASRPAVAQDAAARAEAEKAFPHMNRLSA